MPYMRNGKRDYQAEKAWDHRHDGGKRIKDRAERNAARKEMGVKVGNPKQVDHIKPIVSGGTNAQSNLRIVAARTNLEKEAKRKQKGK